MDNQQLQKLIEKIKGHDKRAFEELYDHYYDKLGNYIFRRCGNKEDTEEILSNTFLKLLKNIESFEWKGGGFNGWIYRIALNEMNQYYRKGKNLTFHPTEELEEKLHSIPDTDTIEERNMKELDYKTVADEIKFLNPTEQDVVTMKFFSELDNHEISEVMNITEASVRVYLHRALKKLEDRLMKKDLNYITTENN